MVRIEDVIKIIEEFAPLNLAAEYDNSGLKIGNVNAEITGVIVTVDTNIDVVTEAVRKKCNLIIEHHPSIWKPLRALSCDIPLNRVLIECAKNDIVLYSAHTNVDFAEGGLNDFVAQKLGLKNIYAIDSQSARVGITEKTDLLKFAKRVSEIFSDDNIITVGNLDKPIEKVAVINGAGGNEEEMWLTYKEGADVFVTSEVKYNVTRLAKELDYAIIQVGHYESEAFFMQLIKNVINHKLPDLPVFSAESIGSSYNRRGEIWN